MGATKTRFPASHISDHNAQNGHVGGEEEEAAEPESGNESAQAMEFEVVPLLEPEGLFLGVGGERISLFLEGKGWKGGS